MSLSAGRLAVMVALIHLAIPVGFLPAQETPTKKPRVEVVFCLDTTGSMGGLIDGAKKKIWSISNQIAGGKPTPELKVGLVAYRDRGDTYVTKVTDLTDDLDAIHAELQTFTAQGGGDTPESVNQALEVAVNKVRWSTDSKVLKILFLVGDAPPHMDYADDVKYPVTCQKAASAGIIVNTIQCGNNTECQKFWQEIARKAEGTYVQIAQSGGVVAIASPFDKRLAEINVELARATVTFGDARTQAAGEAKKDAAAALGAAPGAAPVAADRAGRIAKDGRIASFDLLDAVRDKKVKLEDLKEEELPPELRKLTLEQRKAHLDDLAKKRAKLAEEATELDRKRGEFLRKKQEEQKKTGAQDGFDQQVVDMLRKQAEKYQIKY